MMMNMMKMMVRMVKMEMMRMMIEITNLFIHLREQVLFVFKLPKHSLKKHQSISICSTFLQSTVQKVILIFHCNWIQNIKHWISMNFTKAKNLKSRQCYARTRCWNERFLSIRWIRATFVVQSGLLQQSQKLQHDPSPNKNMQHRGFYSCCFHWRKKCSIFACFIIVQIGRREENGLHCWNSWNSGKWRVDIPKSWTPLIHSH